MSTDDPPDRASASSAMVDLVGVVAVLVAVNLLVAFVLDGWVAGTAVVVSGIGLVGLARVRGYRTTELGLAVDTWSSGLVWGLAAAAVIAVGVFVAVLVPATRGFFDDDRFLDLSAGDLWFEAGVRIPFVTALGEELLFRAVLLAVLLRMTPPVWAVVWSSLLFGLWHVFTTVDDLGGNESSDDLTGLAVVGAVVGIVLVTGVAGAAFSWLRLRSHSVIAPWLAHTAINASTFVAGAVVVRQGWV